LKQTIKNIIPDSIKTSIKRLFSAKPKFGWLGNYSTWKAANDQCTGYDSDVILETVKTAVLKVKNGEAVYERDSVLFDAIEYSQPLLAAFESIAKENNNELHVVDFGGSLGSSYFQNRSLLKNIKKLEWSVVEQKHFVDCGKTSIEDERLKFYYSIEEALGRGKANVLLLSSVIQYFEFPYELIEKCLNYNFDYIIVDRTAFIESQKERITIQIVPESIYKASYPSWFFNEQKFINAFSKKYDLLTEFDSKFDPKERLEDQVMSYRKGFVFKRK
jgi:putative methyltransferase (TIGR04325 family)